MAQEPFNDLTQFVEKQVFHFNTFQRDSLLFDHHRQVNERQKQGRPMEGQI